MENTQHLIADIPVKALIRSDVRILLVQEPDEQWALPGGRLEEGEQPEEGLLREVKEELGIEIEVGRILDATIFRSENGQNHCVIVFESTLIGSVESTVPNGKEIKDMKWVTMEDALRLKLRPEYREMFERM